MTKSYSPKLGEQLGGRLSPGMRRRRLLLRNRHLEPGEGVGTGGRTSKRGNPSFSGAAAECQCIQFKLSSLRLSFSPLKVWKRRKEMRGRNQPNAEKISGPETATASREEKEEAEE